MTQDEYLAKLYSFQYELDNCNSKESLKDIEERLKRRLIDVFPDNDPLITKCKSSWRSSPRAIASLQNALGDGCTYVSEKEETQFHREELRKNVVHFKTLVSKIISTIEKDGLPFNTKTSTIINVNSSPGTNVAAGNFGNTTQSSSVSMSNFNNCYEQAVTDIKRTEALTEEQKEELLDMLDLFKESVERDETPKKTILKRLSDYSLYATSVGANMVTLWGFIEPYLNQLPK